MQNDAGYRVFLSSYRSGKITATGIGEEEISEKWL
jgi:hypothetical protein